MVKEKKVKDTAYYDKLNVKPDASTDELKKAYRKQALRLHPDRGGDPEQFKSMKNAYDVLNDPQKRKLYDKYGPEVVRVMDGEVGSPEAMMAAFTQISKRERMLLILLFCAISFIILLFPILLSLQWDNVYATEETLWSWAIVFIPLFVFEFLILVAFAFFVRAPEAPNEHDSDEESREMYRKEKNNLNVLRAYFCTNVLLIIGFEVMLILKLNNNVTYNWYATVSLWVAFELFSWMWNTMAAINAWLAVSPQGSSFQCAMWKEPSLWSAILFKDLWVVCRMITAFLIAALQEGDIQESWYIVGIPIYIGFAITLLRALATTQKVKTTEGTEVEAGLVAKLITWLCYSSPWLIMVFVAAAKLDGAEYSSFAIWSPLFALVFCCCCLSSCTVLCINPETMAEAQKQAHQQQQQGGAQNDEHVDETSPMREENSPYGATAQAKANENAGEHDGVTIV